MRLAILDDYQRVALKLAEWTPLAGAVEITVFDRPLGDQGAVARALQGFAIVCIMRERTAFPASLLERLPDLKLLVTSGKRNEMRSSTRCSGTVSTCSSSTSTWSSTIATTAWFECDEEDVASQDWRGLTFALLRKRALQGGLRPLWGAGSPHPHGTPR